jgi:hypothetical protein
MAGVVMAMNGCAECLQTQRAIDRLTEARQRLKQQLRYQERQATAGFFGAATPSAKRPVKANPPPPKALTRRGARPGHPGAGRQAVDASQAERGETSRPASRTAALTATRTAQSIATMEAPAQHLGIRRLQEIFRANADRLYHGADDRRVPAEHNLAERDLRPTVIARNVRFGSQSDAGAHTRGIVMAVLHTLKKRQLDVVAPLKRVLDQLTIDLHQDPFPLLFPTDST